MILGHAALAVLAKRTTAKAMPITLLLVAAYGPDLIDKTGMLLLGTSSKGIGHTLAMFAAVSMALALAFRRWQVLVLLWLSHLVLDLTEKSVLFWPLFGPLPVSAPYDLSEGFISFYSGRGSHAVLALDLACIAVTLTVMWAQRRKKA